MGILGTIIQWWQLRRMYLQLAKLRLEDTAVRAVSGATTAVTVEKMVELGHKIAVLRFKIRKLKEK